VASLNPGSFNGACTFLLREQARFVDWLVDL
jgi:hypothetical protein